MFYLIFSLIHITSDTNKEKVWMGMVKRMFRVWGFLRRGWDKRGRKGNEKEKVWKGIGKCVFRVHGAALLQDQRHTSVTPPTRSANQANKSSNIHHHHHLHHHHDHYGWYHHSIFINTTITYLIIITTITISTSFKTLHAIPTKKKQNPTENHCK